MWGMGQNPYDPPSSVTPTEPPSTVPKPRDGSRMDGPELFGALVRAIGLYFIVLGTGSAIHGFLISAAHAQEVDPWSYARSAVSYLAPGIILFFFSKKIVRLAYGDEREQRSEEFRNDADQT
jgi:hypothetical protein